MTEEDAHLAEPLPAATRLDRGRQARLFALVVAAIALMFLLVAAGRWWSRPDEVVAKPLPPGAFRPTAAQLAQLKVQPVGVGEQAEAIEATGLISIDQDRATPVILPFSGQVADVLVEAGASVARGQPLMRISSPDLVDARNALLAAVAARTNAAAQVAIAAENARRANEIYQTAGGALKDSRQAQAELVAAQSSLRSADAAVEAARDKLALFGSAGGDRGSLASVVYRAPAAGIVASRDVAPGQYVGGDADKPLMTIADLSTVWLVAQVPESEAADVKVGDPVTVTTPAWPGRSFAATVDNVAATLDPVSRRLAVRASIANPDGALKPQMSASFTIRRPVASGAGILVPAQAVIQEGDSARVWVAARDGNLYARAVALGETAGGLSRITNGLRPGDRIVTAGALFVNEAGNGQ